MHKSLLRPVGLIFAAILVLTLPGWKPAVVSRPLAPVTAVDLPQQARSPISALIGADQAAYHARQSVNGFTTYNSEHNLSAKFTTTGVSFLTGAYTWGLSLLGYGYGEALQPVAVVPPAAKGNRIEYPRGPLS
ncbi:MAG: hypothetical protein MUP03_04485, partial [Anaerolineales bacterium]|nr:hypothetical protein [Anaerolineales bacterium]